MACTTSTLMSLWPPRRERKPKDVVRAYGAREMIDKERQASLERTVTEDRRDDLLLQDWSTVWESLPDAPPLVPRPRKRRSALRLPGGLLARIKLGVGARRTK